jgi:methyltransferase (TIGR00027 family)
MRAPERADALVRSVSDTARWAAACRAMESARHDAHFNDPYAAGLAGDRGMSIAARSPPQVRNGWPVIARTKAIDDLIQRSLAEGCDRVLNLAAGLDARPYRLDLPASLDWIEADLPALVAEKNAALAHAVPRCRLVREAVDLADPAARAAFLDRALAGANRVLVITEGLLMYLTDEVVRSLALDFARPSVAAWILDTLSPATRDEVMRRMDETLASAPMLFAPPEGIAFFEALGWRTTEMRSLLEEARRLRRLPWLLQILAELPLPQPDPRKLARRQWSAVVRLSQ